MLNIAKKEIHFCLIVFWEQTILTPFSRINIFLVLSNINISDARYLFTFSVIVFYKLISILIYVHSMQVLIIIMQYPLFKEKYSFMVFTFWRKYHLRFTFFIQFVYPNAETLMALYYSPLPRLPTTWWGKSAATAHIILAIYFILKFRSSLLIPKSFRNDGSKHIFNTLTYWNYKATKAYHIFSKVARTTQISFFANKCGVKVFSTCALQ